MITGVAAKQNPFPGLRPFREDEEHFFFGRESQIDTMVNKLAATRFLAVVGTSGSGKSSLVNCGLRPALHRGLMASAGPAWRMAQFRPAVNPIQSLACALAENGVLYSGYKEDVPIEEIVETYLHQSEKGVVKTFQKARLPKGESRHRSLPRTQPLVLDAAGARTA
jgi:ABC-type branched-subunit amino acid transport system ATPase component